MTEHFVIVGAGECGARAAMGLREQGFQGDVTLIGEEAHLPYERPPLSKQAMAGDDAAGPKCIVTAQRLEQAGIGFRGRSRVEAIDAVGRLLELECGETLAFDTLLLATGASPRRLPGAEGKRLVYLRTFEDAQRIRGHLQAGQRIVIIGGGFIGLELAASARQRGAEVVVIEAQARLLSRGVPEAIAWQIETRHRDNGVQFRFGLGIAGIADGTEGATVTLQSGTRIEADLVLIGIGAQPNTVLAEAAGLAIDNGVAVDRFLGSSHARILAAGDCCSFPLEIYGGRRVRLESWRNAQDQGNLAARNMLGAEEEITHVPWFWSEQYDLTLQVAGLADEGAMMVRRDLGDGAMILFHLAADGRLVAASGIGVGNAVARDIRLAEMLIGKRARPDVAALRDAGVRLKGLLAA